MALPSSGQIKMSEIGTELSCTLSNLSLNSMSNTAGKSSPHGMSEFYGYSAPISVEILAVAGGAGGGRSSGREGGGGGGAGGYRTLTETLDFNTQYYVSIGAGGAGGTSTRGANGGDSTFHLTTSNGGGGGGGGSSSDGPGLSGGSGGGASAFGGNKSGGAGNTPATNPSQGNNGGDGIWYQYGFTYGGGGGGAGGAGCTGTNTSGNGGPGLANSITGTSVTRASGGFGVNNGGGTSASSNTGDGGQGGRGVNGGSGGSGMVILRYPNSATLCIGAGLSATCLNCAVGTNERYTCITAGTGNICLV